MISLLLFFSVLTAVLAEDCSHLTHLLPRNSEYNRACSATDPYNSPCFRHTSGSLRSVHVTNAYTFKDEREGGLLIKDGFLTDFSLDSVARLYIIEYLDAGIALEYLPLKGSTCFELLVNKYKDWGWQMKVSVPDGTALLDTRDKVYERAKFCDRRVDIALEKS